MSRFVILSLLEAYQPIDEQEQQFKPQMIKFIEEHVDCFNRECIPGHMTASTWLLDKSGEQVLLMHHTKLDKWLQLGGHADGNSDLLAVAIKEAQEESGIQNIEPIDGTIFDIDIHVIPAFKDIPEHTHYDVRFVLRVTSDESYVKNEESKELRWFSKTDDFPSKSRTLERMRRKWLAL